MIKILAFDLSTTQTGVAVASVTDNCLMSLDTISITPKSSNPADLGFLKTKQRVTTKSGAQVSSYVKQKGEIVTKKEAKARNLLVKKYSETSRLTETVSEISSLLDVYAPSLVLMEENMAFRNIDTTRQLAEVAGALQAMTSTRGIELEKINVLTARSHWNISKECIAFSRTLTESDLKAVKDLTKETLKALMLSEFRWYKLSSSMSTDESDALVLIFHWLTKNDLDWRKDNSD